MSSVAQGAHWKIIKRAVRMAERSKALRSGKSSRETLYENQGLQLNHFRVETHSF